VLASWPMRIQRHSGNLSRPASVSVSREGPAHPTSAMGCITGDLDGQETPGQVTMSVIEITTTDAKSTFGGILSHWWIMVSPTWSTYLLSIVMAVVGTWWVVWPDRYVAWLQATKQKLRRTPAMRSGVDRVEAVWPLTSKPWYPQLVRVAGILLWVLVPWIALHGL
jgi:hypothetical protein